MPTTAPELHQGKLFATECDWMVGHTLLLRLMADRPPTCRAVCARANLEHSAQLAGSLWFAGCERATCPYCGDGAVHT